MHRRSFSDVLGVTLDEDYWNTQCVGHSPRDIMARHLPEGRLKPGESVDTLLQSVYTFAQQIIEAVESGESVPKRPERSTSRQGGSSR